MRLSGNFPLALDGIIRSAMGQRFTQPKAILLQVLAILRKDKSAEVGELSEGGIQQIAKLSDPVLNFALKHLSN